jgi:hypothetical protein
MTNQMPIEEQSSDYEEKDAEQSIANLKGNHMYC